MYKKHLTALHYPVYIEIGSVKILLHTIFEVSGMFIGFRYFIYLRKKQGDQIKSENRIWIIIGAIFGAILGSRLVGGFENPIALFASKNPLFYIYQNKTVLGGFLGGVFGVELIKLIVKEKKSSGDLFTFPMILALMIGRVGCFSMGVFEETYGSPTTFFAGMNLGDGILRHPVNLYEMVFLLGLWIGLVQIEKKYTLAEGGRFKIFMIAYVAFRFLLDFIKPHYTFSFGLSTIQIVCALGLIYYLPYIVQPKKLLQKNHV
ncbi:MAG: prolipoprotein diacylglyceryl transferase [Chitinophagaceae bacterium]|nr:prolipoprotein diacylglyceryl transferase [Chitinophagaceae bacterium]